MLQTYPFCHLDKVPTYSITINVRTVDISELLRTRWLCQTQMWQRVESWPRTAHPSRQPKILPRTAHAHSENPGVTLNLSQRLIIDDNTHQQPDVNQPS